MPPTSQSARSQPANTKNATWTWDLGPNNNLTACIPTPHTFRKDGGGGVGGVGRFVESVLLGYFTFC